MSCCANWRVDQFLSFAIDTCKRLCAPLAEDSPIRYGVENHGKITNDPQSLTGFSTAVCPAGLA